MATKSYAELNQQIAELTAKAEQVRLKEVASVVARIKEAIATYGITAADLGLSTVQAPKRSVRSAPARGRKRAESRTEAKYQDGAGNVWGGRGPRPRWLRAAIAEGKSLESFAVGGDAPGSEPAAAPSPARTMKATASASAKGAKFKDDAGNAWSGRGPRPAWFKKAIAAGKTPEELTA
jgi:DNA-binding protein H-NS